MRSVIDKPFGTTDDVCWRADTAPQLDVPKQKDDSLAILQLSKSGREDDGRKENTPQVISNLHNQCNEIPQEMTHTSEQLVVAHLQFRGRYRRSERKWEAQPTSRVVRTRKT